MSLPDPVPEAGRGTLGTMTASTLPRRLLAALALLIAPPLPALAQATADAPAIAAGGFGRPVRLGTIDAGDGAQVAVAGGRDGPAAVWEDGGGLVLQPLDPADASEPRRLVDSRGVRGLWAGDAGGDALVAWLERDLRDGGTRLAWRWRDETRTLATTGQAPRVRVVRGADAPQALLAVPSAEGWRLELHDWSGEVRTGAPRPAALTVAGLDAARTPGGVAASWLEGSNEVVLGRLDAAWTARLAVWPDGAATPGEAAALGDARHVGDGDATRLSVDGQGRVEVGWPGADGVLRVGSRASAPVALGTGTLLGRVGGAWTWVDGAEVRRREADGTLRTVLRLPAAPEHAAAAHAGGVTGVVWSSGRYLGGLEVWGVTDRVAYRAGWLERLALAMGWDPWRPWSAAGGHLLLSVLTALLAASVLTPAWWLGAALAARRADGSSRAVARDGAALGIGTVLAGAGAIVVAARTGAGLALVGGPVWIACGLAAGVAAAWAASAGRDLDATFGRLVVAWAAGTAMLLVLAFGGLTAWQRLFGALA